MSSDVLLNGWIEGRLPGRPRDFVLYFLELTGAQLHIFDGQNQDTPKHLLSVRIDSSDVAGVESKVRKGSGEFRFFLERPGDGKYIFKVMQESVRDNWVEVLQRVINKESLDKITGLQSPTSNAFSPDNVGSRVMKPTKVDTPSFPRTPPTTSRMTRGRTSTGSSTSVLNTALPPTPEGSSPRASIISTDSGIGTSVGGEVRRPSVHKSGSSSVPNSGSGTFSNRGGSEESGGKGKGHSADAEFTNRVTVSNEDTPKWFWGTMNREECEKQLKEKGEIGNFVVRVNATGHHIMSFWRVDGVHHHKILSHEGMWRFEKAAVSAEGESLADLLDTYMKNCTKDKNIKPFGGGLFENYTYAWTPQEFDMGLLEKKLKQQKELREKAKKPRRKQGYTPVEVDTGLDDERGGFENDDEEPAIRIKKNKPLPLPPMKKPGSKSPKLQSPPLDTSPKALPKPPAGSKDKTGGLKPPAGSKGSGGSTLPKPSTASKAGKLGDISGTASLGRGNAGLAMMQEFTSKKGRKMTKSSTCDEPAHKTTPPPSVHSLSQESYPEVEESEPLYANTTESAAKTTGDKPYQNMEFNGPPSAGGGKASPPSTSKSSTSDLSSSQSEYQNINFSGKKAAPKKKKPRAGAHMNGTTSPDNAPPVLPKPPSTNNSEGVYQNTAFKGKR